MRRNRGEYMKNLKKLTILHSNDMHGDFLAEQIDERLVGGVSLLSGYVNKVRREEKNVIYAIAGDMFRGSVIDSEYHIANPLLFYTNVCGNVSEDYDRENIDSQLKTELLTALQPAFAKISEMGIRYSALPGHTVELADALNEALSAKWRDLRGIEVVSFGVSSVTANEEDEKMIKEMQRNAAFMDPTRAAAHLAGATGDAMKTAAANPNGAVGAFMGVGMAGGMAGAQMGTLYQQGAQQQAAQAQAQAAPAAAGWTCSCGQTGNTGKFCANCGKPAPAPANEWTCECGARNTGKFCSECGKPAPASEWTCDCGTVNKGKFCSNCGKPFGG